MREVLVLRHAKSDRDDPSLTDHDRPLARRGRADLPLIAGHLEATGTRPGLVLCSTARRARETLDGVLDALPEGTAVTLTRELYLATSGELLDVLRGLDDKVTSTLLCGHDPGLHDLAVDLVGRGPVALRAALADRLPTGGMVRLACDVPTWAELAPGCAELVEFVTPRELAARASRR